jgi:hypothetical protein
VAKRLVVYFSADCKQNDTIRTDRKDKGAYCRVVI